LIALFGGEVEDRWLWCAGHFALILPAWIVSRLRSVLAEVLLALLVVPLGFTVLGSFLPSLVPEPMAWRVQEWDALLGGSAAIEWAKQAPVWLLEISQLCYASYYFLPVALAVVLYRRRRYRELAEGTSLIAGAFFLSYLGYFMFPTLPPYRFVDYGAELGGGPIVSFLWPLLYELEPIRENCVPSGHTMITLAAFVVAWRYAREQLLWLLPVGAFLILGTVILRLHWLIDLFAALPFLGVMLWALRQPALRSRSHALGETV
jgi:membrane-associated phospholipid phosphatase